MSIQKELSDNARVILEMCPILFLKHAPPPLREASLDLSNRAQVLLKNIILGKHQTFRNILRVKKEY